MIVTIILAEYHWATIRGQMPAQKSMRHLKGTIAMIHLREAYSEKRLSHAFQAGAAVMHQNTVEVRCGWGEMHSDHIMFPPNSYDIEVLTK